jgi:class 3 adenylate cyclase
VTQETTDLVRELEAARRQQRALARVLAAIASGQGLQSVLDEIVGEVMMLCSSENGRMWLMEDGLLHAVANRGWEQGWEYDKAHPHTIDRGSGSGRAALTHEPVHIPDVREDPEYTYTGSGAFRTNLSVPILHGDEVIGVFGLVREERQPFSEDQIELVQAFANQAAIAIANARLLDAVERQLDQQRAIGDILGVVARAEGLEAVFGVVVDAAKRLCRADYGALYLAEGDVFYAAVQRGGSLEQAEYERSHPHPRDRRTVVGRVALTRAPVHISDALADPEYSWPGQQLGEHRATLGVPILVEDDLIGVIGVVRYAAEPFTPEQIELVRTFSDQAAIAIVNARLIDAVERQRTELARFVSPQIAELVSSQEGEKMLGGHRAYITCLFCDLRGFTAFAETAAPEELMEVLGEYHELLGRLIPEHDGTLEHFAGDGVMVFFNDPVPVEDHELQAIRFAVAAQARFAELAGAWRKHGIELGLGIGISAGYATLGRIGFEGRYDYGALGPVTNLASRLSSEARAGQTLVGQRLYAAVEDQVEAELVGELELKGFARAVPAYAVRGLR